mmetsp:Transcript_93157/g.301196  ORF Transcript_93157/g.301196 Transcript_93157/m.301196 type:complete len:207 (+) Transcript_93157:1438-2058(+)
MSRIKHGVPRVRKVLLRTVVLPRPSQSPKRLPSWRCEITWWVLFVLRTRLWSCQLAALPRRGIDVVASSKSCATPGTPCETSNRASSAPRATKGSRTSGTKSSCWLTRLPKLCTMPGTRSWTHRLRSFTLKLGARCCSGAFLMMSTKTSVVSLPSLNLWRGQLRAPCRRLMAGLPCFWTRPTCLRETVHTCTHTLCGHGSSWFRKP